MVFPVMQEGKMVDGTGRSLSGQRLPKWKRYGKSGLPYTARCGKVAVVAQFSTAVIALDPDALPKTLQMAKELRGYVNDVRVLRLTDDLKYRNPEDMEKLNGIITD